jgi:hypothetical protein
MENNINYSEEDIKNQIKELLITRDKVFQNIVKTVSANSELFEVIDKAIFKPINQSIAFTYNPLISEENNGQSTSTSTNIQKN